MQFITRPVLAAAAALALSAAPALARSTASSKAPVRAKTALTAKIAQQTPLVQLRYTLGHGVSPGLGSNALAADHAAYDVSHVHADSAQLPAKLEWVLGADLQRRADNTIGYGQHLLVYHHPTPGQRLVERGLAELRLSNYFFANADTLLGVAHPKYTAAPYQPHKNRPLKVTSPLIAKAPKPTPAAIITMGTPLLEQTVPEQILGTDVALNQAAAAYYTVLIARVHVGAAQRAAQREWVAGARALSRGDQQLYDGIAGVRYGNGHQRVAGKREIQSALTTFRHADDQLSHADALLGVHHSGPTVKLPTTVIYKLSRARPRAAPTPTRHDAVVVGGDARPAVRRE